MAKSSFYSGRGVTPENPDVTPVEPNNINAIEDSKNAAALSEAAAEASKDAAAQSASDAAASETSANASKISAEQAANFAGAFSSVASTHADNAATSATAAAASEAASAASEAAAAASETAAAGSLSSVNQSANLASTKAGEASTSAANAAASEAAAATSASDAASSVASIGNSEANAAASAAAAAASEAAASTSASNSATSASNAASSATSASASQVAAAASEVASAASEVASAASEAASATSESNASTSESNAASSATSASASAATATTQASNAATSAGQSASSAANSATSEVNAAASEVAAAASESASATSEANAANSASAAATSATQSAASAASIGNAEANSAASATQAAASAANAASSESNAATSESNAATSAANSATSASNASQSASDSATSASTAQGAAQTATSQASSAAAQAANAASSATSATASQAAASASAGAASSSASAAAASASSAQASKDAALAALDNFDDRYLGQKTSDPSTDNDGDALVSGALYFNTTDDIMKVYDGSAWVAAYASLSGTLTSANNLSDLSNASDARTNLGLAIGTDVQAYDSVLAGTTASYTTAQSAKLAGIENGATADQTITAGAGLDGGGTGDVTLSHSNTSSVQNTSNASNTFIQNLSFDTYGHVTSVSNGSMSIGSGTLSISGSGKIQGGGTFGANQSGNTTITLTHAASSASSVNNSGGTVIQDITLDSTGHISSIGSYNLDSRYYTETEANSLFVNAAGDSMSGNLTIASGNASQLILDNSSDSAYDVKLQTAHDYDGWFRVVDGGGTTRFAVGRNSEAYIGGIGGSGGNRAFHDSYHPNADKWTTARTLSLSGDASGSVSWDGSANATLSVTVADNSHSHSNYITDTGGDTRTGNLAMYGTDTSGSYASAPIELREVNAVTSTQSAYAYAPAIAWHWDGRKQMQMRLHSDGHLYVDGSNYGQSKVWTAGNDGSGSGLDADLLDGYHLSGTRNAANTVPVRDGNGYLQLGWINTTSGATTSTVNKIYASYDNYVRYITPATFRSQITDGSYEPINGTILHQGGDISSHNWNDFINGTEASWNTVVNHSGSNRPSSAYTYGLALSFSESAQAKFQLYAPHNGSEGNSLWYRTGWNTDYDAWAKIWDSANDGAGSGLDADTVDGIHGSSLLRSDTTDNATGKINFEYSVSNLNSVSGSKGVTPFKASFQASNRAGSGNYNTGLEFVFDDSGARTQLVAGSDGNNDIPHLYTRGEGWGGANGWHSWYELWHSGNDGSGSGLDADTLDGYHASSFHINSYNNDVVADAAYVDNWFRARHDTGLYFEDKGTGLRSVLSEGGEYGSVATYAGENGWEGWSIGGRVVFMHDMSNAWGIYNDVDNEWMIYGNRNAEVRLRYNNADKLLTSSTGVTVSGTVAATSYTGDGSQLTGIAAGAVGGVFYENDQNVTSSYTITNGKNAMSAGPITINSGVTVTVGSGETWTVV